MKWRSLGAGLLCLAVAACSRTSWTGGETSSTTPIIPMIGAAKKAVLRGLFLEGQGAGYANAGDVFAKLGDSITELSSFLRDIGCGDITYGTAAGTTQAELGPTISWFSAHLVPGDGFWCGRQNAFMRGSTAAVAGWVGKFVLLRRLGETDPSDAGRPARWWTQQ